MNSILSEFVAQVQRIRHEWGRKVMAVDYPDSGSILRQRYRLLWDQTPEEVADYINRSQATLDQAREELTVALEAYVDQHVVDHALLVTLAPGIGKSFGAIELAQRQAAFGQRVLYAMPRNDYWDDITISPAFNPSHWHRWRSVNAADDLGEPVCRFSQAQAAWTGKGYRMMSACQALCLPDGHYHVCPYRQQMKTEKLVIAGVHNHVVTGMAIDDFELVVFDELPLSAYLTTREIPAKFLDVKARGVVAEFINHLYGLVFELDPGQVLQGPALMERIEGHFARVLHNIDHHEAGDFPEPPEIHDSTDALTAPVNYLFDLVKLLIPEFIAYRQGATDWLSRVSLTHNTLQLHMRNKTWESAPDRMVILDATGDAGFYEQLLQRPVKELHLNVGNQGRIFQVTHRLNGRSTIFEEHPHGVNLLPGGRQLLTLAQIIATSKPLPDKRFEPYRRVGVVTFKGLVPYFEDIFGVGNVMHFGGSRGKNDFVVADGEQPYDCIIVAGSPAPSDGDLETIFSQVWFDPDEPDSSRVTRPDFNRTMSFRWYYLSDSGLSPKREMSGFTHDDELETLHRAFTQAELQQAVGRGRAKVFENVDVWVLTSTPIRDTITGIYDTPTGLNIPQGIAWYDWLAIYEFVNSRQMVTAEDLAERFAVSPRQALNWMHAIHEWNPVTFQIGKRKGYGNRVILYRW